MDYHSRNKSGNGVIKMPPDGFAFRNIEEKWLVFKEEPYNVRISLAIDGVNPVGIY